MTSTPFRAVADLLKTALLAEVKDQIHSIVLFGSVARDEATSDSDVDILIITEAPFEVRQHIGDLATTLT
ncbi:MAG: nucleotidyltransferase domain-containing protein [Chloroflexi bacterium]|nr:nucleotidyltransferase domain-containing protein [Chloroflexota bacterium]